MKVYDFRSVPLSQEVSGAYSQKRRVIMKSNKSKAIALISVVVFALAIAALKFENTLGILPILVAIIAFFTCVIHTSMYLSNVKRAEAVSHSDYSQNSNRHTLNQDINERDKKR
ncbi:hypothetical protein CGH76_17030 [Vibrio parahaemolyticus]|nr:hypothetical protein [Vibrio parahaemolyticus]EGR2892064.1 hypothetical protein [Vibrio parahaemolyticus]EGR2932207.1 hypothetical protein [Vibrio parahaemolyticus]EGR2955964.1 hypothetical protein [Vibrio parahaemolyticus]EGR2961153.1 hypothetical protein [Vibrio parahaemolyticus]